MGTDASSDSRADTSEPPATVGTSRCPEGAPLDFTLRVVSLSGHLDLDGRNAGATFRPDWAQNAYLEATDVFTGRRFSGEVDLNGNYDLELFASSYDLAVRFNEAWCVGACPYVPLASGLEVLEDTAFDDQVEIVLHTVSLSLDGDAEVPSNDERVGRGYLDYVDVETNRTIRRPLNTVRPAAGRAWIPKDRVYDLYWTTEQLRPQRPGEPAAALPVGSYLLGQVDTREGGGDRYEVSSLVIDVTLWFDGERIPDDGILDGEGRGRLTISRLGGLGTLQLVDVGETGDAFIDLRVFPGPHSAMFQPGQADVQDALEAGDTSAACGLTDEPCDWTSPGRFVLDFTSLYREAAETVEARGSLELVDESGAPLEFGDECGTVQIVFLEAGTSDYAAIANIEGGVFETATSEGPKDIWVLSGWDAGCFIGGSLVAENVEVGAGAVELQATAVPLDTTLLVNGEPMPDDTLLDENEDGRGRLQFIPLGYGPGHTAETYLAETGPAVWDGWVLAGEYEVLLKTMEIIGRVGEQPMEQDVLPSTTRSLGQLSVTESTSMTYDLPVLHVTGSVTVLPEDTELIDAPEDLIHGINLVSASDGFGTTLGHDENGEFGGLVYADSYRIDYVASGYAEYDLRVLAPVLPAGSEDGLWGLECGE